MLWAADATNYRVGWTIALLLVAWVALNAIIATYGSGRGYPFLPLMVCGMLFGPLGPPVVLLTVTIAAGPRRRG